MPTVNAQPTLGQGEGIGPLPTMTVPSFGVDTNVLVIGVGVLGVIWLFGGLGRKARTTYGTYQRERKRKSKRRKELQEELRTL